MVRDEISERAGRLAEGDRLEIMLLGAPSAGQPAEMSTLFAACRPKSPENAGLDKGSQVLAKQLQSDWVEPLKEALSLIDSRMGIPATTTPLAASLKALRARMAAQHKELIVFSDMLNNTNTLNHYGPAQDFATLREQRVDEAMVDGLFAGTEITVYQMLSATALARQARAQKFWDEWLAASGGSRIYFSRI